MRPVRKSLIGVTALVAGASTGIGLAACGLEQTHGYVQSADGSLSFRHPRHWNEVDVDPTGFEWLVVIDASAAPSVERFADPVQDDPMLVAEVMPLEKAQRAQLSLASLRRLALPDRRDPTTDDPAIRVLFHDEVVDDQGFEGHHIRFEVELDNGTAVTEHLAVFDPGRERVEHLRVTCSETCFTANEASIEDVFESVRFRE
jgi:hypothetical protein